MGFAFAFGVVAVSLRRLPGDWARRAFDLIAVATSIVIPLSMSFWDDRAGVLQRAMFLVAYLWFASEAVGIGAEQEQTRS